MGDGFPNKFDETSKNGSHLYTPTLTKSNLKLAKLTKLIKLTKLAKPRKRCPSYHKCLGT